MVDTLITELAGLSILDAETVFFYAGVFARMGAAAFLAPGIGDAATPMRVRLFAAFALTAVAAPAARPAELDFGDTSDLAFMLLAEAAIGLLIGLTIRFVVIALHIAGTIAAQAMQLSQLFGAGVGHEQESQISTLLMMAGVAIACAAGLHVELALAFSKSYAVAPFGGAFPASDAARHIVDNAAGAIALGFSLAIPFLLLGFVYSLALGAMNRAMPQLAVAFVGAPIAISAGAALLGLCASLILSRWSAHAGPIFAAPLGFAP
jgi:flagellar biosynthetic protein FliR